jgi:hypothetical protein
MFNLVGILTVCKSLRGQLWLTPVKGSFSINQEYVPAQVVPLPSSRGIGSAQYFRQPYQQGRQMGGVQSNYAGAQVIYGRPQNFGYPYLQPFQQFQTQQPVAYGNATTGYYPAQQNFVRNPYDNTPGMIFRQEHGYLAPPNAVGPSALHGDMAAGLHGPVSLHTGSTCKFATAYDTLE